jgi:hypothetical protein
VRRKRVGEGELTMEAKEVEQADLVDEFYVPLVRALGNLVILFAQAEADLIDLLTELNGGDEKAAHEVLKSRTAKEEILALLEASGIQKVR